MSFDNDTIDDDLLAEEQGIQFYCPWCRIPVDPSNLVDNTAEDNDGETYSIHQCPNCSERIPGEVGLRQAAALMRQDNPEVLLLGDPGARGLESGTDAYYEHCGAQWWLNRIDWDPNDWETTVWPHTLAKLAIDRAWQEF